MLPVPYYKVLVRPGLELNPRPTNSESRDTRPCKKTKSWCYKTVIAIKRHQNSISEKQVKRITPTYNKDLLITNILFFCKHQLRIYISTNIRMIDEKHTNDAKWFAIFLAHNCWLQFAITRDEKHLWKFTEVRLLRYNYNPKQIVSIGNQLRQRESIVIYPELKSIQAVTQRNIPRELAFFTHEVLSSTLLLGTSNAGLTIVLLGLQP